MTSDRPYLEGMPSLQAKDVMEEKAGRDFDPDVVAAFARVFARGEMEAPSLGRLPGVNLDERPVDHRNRRSPRCGHAASEFAVEQLQHGVYPR